MDAATIFGDVMINPQGVPPILQKCLGLKIKNRIKKLTGEKPGNLIGMVSLISNDPTVDLNVLDRKIRSQTHGVEKFELEKKQWSVVWKLPSATGYKYMTVSKLRWFKSYFVVAEYFVQI